MGPVPFRLPAVVSALALLGALAGRADAPSPATRMASVEPRSVRFGLARWF